MGGFTQVEPYPVVSSLKQNYDLCVHIFISYQALVSAGDIGEILPNGIIKVIDRKKNLIKLSQGEYIALEYLENVYGITPIVEDVRIYLQVCCLRKAFQNPNF